MMQNKKWLTMLIAFVVSVGLWFYVVTVENPVKEITLHNVPVQITGQEVLKDDYELLVVDSNVIGGAEITFTGKISDLNKLQQNKSDVQISIDISHLRDTTSYTLQYDISDIQLPSSISVQDVSLAKQVPGVVSLTLGKLSRKTVPVEVQQNVSLEDGFTAGGLTKSYDEIVVEGPEALVKQVETARAVLERENVSQKVTATLPIVLLDVNGNVIEDPALIPGAKEVEVTLPILLYKEVPVEPVIVDGGGATSDDVIVNVTPKTIRLSGEASVLEGVSSVKLSSSIHLSTLMTNEEVVTRTIIIPEGCTSLSGELEADVNVKIQNKAIRKLIVSSTSFQELALPSDRDVTYKTTALPITIRANEADIDLITEDNLRVVVDFSGMSSSVSSNVSMPVRIYIDGYEGAGVIGDTEYTVLLDIMEGSAS